MRIWTLSLGLLAIFCAFAGDEPLAVNEETVVVKTNGEEVRGSLKNATFHLKTPYGSQEFEGKFIKKIVFRDGDSDSGHDSIELIDEEHFSGKLVEDKIEILQKNGPISLSTKELRQLRTTRGSEQTMWAILLGLVMLAAMEIVLGIDNLVFLAIIAAKLPQEQQPKARRLGLIIALVSRLLLLASLSFLLGLTKPLFTIPQLPLLTGLEAREISTRDLILLVGGAFLIFKSVSEIHEKIEHARQPKDQQTVGKASFVSVLVQIAILDIIFSLDSVITALGMVEDIWVMVVAMIIAMGVMMAFAETISNFVARHATLKILALAFLILIGVLLVAEGMGQHMNKGYIYFAMGFSLLIELINMRIRPGKKEVIPETAKAI
ncbi:MAG: TerC family protein [Zavarzinella sp.]